jgi:hypothetical protein
VTLGELRAAAPQWTWRAERCGFGWAYVGELAFSSVTVRAFSVLCGPAEDDFRTEWRVSEGDHSEPLSMFLLRWRCRADAAAVSETLSRADDEERVYR